MNSNTKQLLIKEIISNYPETQAIYIFGSVAEGSCHEKSDLDVAVLFAPETAKEAGDLSYSDLRVRLDEITKRNTDLINLRLVSIVFKMEIIFKGQRIYTAGLYDAEEFEMLTMSYYQKLNDERREILENFRSSKKAYAV